MPQLTFSDALRYFFAPFVLFFYIAIYDPIRAAWLQTTFGTVGVISFLVGGSAIYLVYRYLVFDYLLLWLKDIPKRDNYRRYLGAHYKVQFGRYWLPTVSLRAERLYAQIRFPVVGLLQKDPSRVRAAGIHMLYQAGLLALPFIAAATIHKSLLLAALFGIFAIVFLFTAWLADKDHEQEEFLLLKSFPNLADDAANLFGYCKLESAR